MFKKLMATNIFKKSHRSYEVPPIPDSIWKNPLHFIAFGFGTGAIPIAPGTFGTLIAIPFYLFLSTYSATFYLIATVIITIFSIWLCEKISLEINIHDHQGMCIDEVVGYLVTMLYAPYGWGWIILGFVLFRIFDIWKPWPIRQLDTKIRNGFGMIIDDVVAGIYSFIIIQILAKVIYK